MKKIFIVVFWVVFSILILPFHGNARVYKYVDENGVPHYTNAPANPKYKPSSKSKKPAWKKKIQKPVKKQTPNENPQR